MLALTIRALPNGAVDLTLVLLNHHELVACITHGYKAGVGYKLSLCLKLDCLLCGDSGQGQVPLSPLLHKALGLLSNGSRVNQMRR